MFEQGARRLGLILAIAVALSIVVATACADDADDDPNSEPPATATAAPRATATPATRAGVCIDGADRDACMLAEAMGRWMAYGDHNAFAILVDGGTPEQVRCENDGGDTYAAWVLCEGAAAGEVRAGYPVAQHGSEGTYMTPAELKASLAAYVAADASLASMGCAVAACHQFVVAFATGEQPAAFYLAFSRTEDAGYVLTGAGMSGDNAETILHGGTTFTVVGEARFAPW